MSPVAFLLIAAAVAVIGTVLVVVMNRKPTRPDAAMAEFEREMRALAPRRTGTDEPGLSTPAPAPADATDQAGSSPDEA